MSAVLKTADQANADNFDLGKMLFDSIAETNRVMMAGVDAGAEGVWIKVGPSLRTLEKQYRAAQADPKAVIPTALSLAIESVLQHAKQAAPADPFADRRTEDFGVSPCGRSRREGE